MMAWLGGVVASKLGAVVVALFALAGVILIPVTIIQTVQINGWPVFGGGLRAQVAALQNQINDPVNGWAARYAGAQKNEAALDTGLKACNASVDGFKAAADRQAKQGASAVALATQRAFTIRALSAQVAAAKAQGPACEALNKLYGETFR